MQLPEASAKSQHNNAPLLQLQALLEEETQRICSLRTSFPRKLQLASLQSRLKRWQQHSPALEANLALDLA